MRDVLDRFYDHYNDAAFIEKDPIVFPRRYANGVDREIVALLAAGLAYGRVAQIFVSVDRVLTNTGEKRQLHVDTGAIGVDMESAAIGEVAQEHGVPFLIVRAISDGAHDDLPVDFNLFLRPSGWVSGIMYIMTTPTSWKGFLDLYRHSKQASLQLTKFFEGFFSVVSRMSPSSRSFDGKL